MIVDFGFYRVVLYGLGHRAIRGEGFVSLAFHYRWLMGVLAIIFGDDDDGNFSIAALGLSEAAKKSRWKGKVGVPICISLQ